MMALWGHMKWGHTPVPISTRVCGESLPEQSGDWLRISVLSRFVACTRFCPFSMPGFVRVRGQVCVPISLVHLLAQLAVEHVLLQVLLDGLRELFEVVGVPAGEREV